jgi:hypothetical protein
MIKYYYVANNIFYHTPDRNKRIKYLMLSIIFQKIDLFQNYTEGMNARTNGLNGTNGI